MALLKKRNAATDSDTAADTMTAEAPAPAVPASPRYTPGKGRPTPKRSEARAARTKVRPPANSKEARARRRAERRAESQRYREAMLSGDVSKLPPREQVPERVLARDFVDTRINVGPFFLIAAVIYFVGGLVPNFYVQVTATYVMLVGIIAVVVDSIVLARQVSRKVAEKYPNSRVRVRAYAVQRALLPRRWRLPRPRVSRGDLIR